MYENAKNGIGKIFTSQILAILAAICALVAAIFAVVAANAVSESLTGGAYSGSIGLAIFTLASVILLVIGYILEMVGLSKAGKDEELFKKAFTVAIIGLVVSIVLGVLSSLTTFRWMIDISEICNFFISLIIVHHVLFGVANICPSISDRAVKVWKIYMAIIIVDIIANIVSIIMALLGLYVGSAILLLAFSIFDAIMQIVAYVMFLSFLATARKTIK